MLASRQLWAGIMGYQYGDARNIYEALGYPQSGEEITYERYLGKYKRHDIGNAVIRRPVNVTWRGGLELEETGDKNETRLESAFNDLRDRLKLKSVFSRLDKLTGIGQYGVLLLGLSDAQKEEDWRNPVKGNKLQLYYVRPVSEYNAEINTWGKDVTKPEYGKPILYNIRLIEADGKESTVRQVHHTRLIHVVDEPLESEIYGTPRLEVVYNRLLDLEKLVGGSAEMYWRGARPGYHGDLDKEFQKPANWDTDLQTQLDEFENGLRRFLTTQGLDIKSLEQQIADPKGATDVAVQMISAATGIPKRILTGTERGELASTQDQDEYMAYVQGRREEFAEPMIIRPFVETGIKYGFLPKSSTGVYTVKWEDLFAKGDKEKAEIGRVRAEALKAYGASGMQAEVPFEAFARFFLGLDTDEIDLIMEYALATINEENTQQNRQTEEEIQ